jgi:hypothetical protein
MIGWAACLRWRRIWWRRPVRGLGEVPDRPVQLLLRTEARELLDPHRPVREPVPEVLVVLLGEQRGRDEHRDLPAVLDGDEGRAHRDLGLAEADVAAHQAVHRPGRGHVGQHRVDGGLLVGGLLEGKGLGEGLVGVGVDVEGVTPDVGIGLTLVGFVGTMAWARLVERGATVGPDGGGPMGPEGGEGTGPGPGGQGARGAAP